MNFIEMVTTLFQRPGYLGVLTERNRVVRLSGTGYLMDATREKPTYINFNAVDAMAVTWECWTPAQLQQMAEQAEQQ